MIILLFCCRGGGTCHNLGGGWANPLVTNISSPCPRSNGHALPQHSNPKRPKSHPRILDHKAGMALGTLPDWLPDEAPARAKRCIIRFFYSLPLNYCTNTLWRPQPLPSKDHPTAGGACWRPCNNIPPPPKHVALYA